MNQDLVPRWAICPIGDGTDDLSEVKDNPLLFCDGEICLMKAMLLAGSEQLANAASGTQETKIAMAASHVYSRFKAVVDTFLGEDDGCEKVPPTQGETGEAPIEDGQIAGSVEPTNLPTNN